jgi:hypothetical protein
MKHVVAQIVWFPPEIGGRKTPAVGRYSPVIRFEDECHKFPREVWSVILDLDTQPNAHLVQTTNMRFLTEENAPLHLFYNGSQFDLFEGHKRVASGRITDVVSKA